MNESSNIVIIIIFAALGIWLLVGFLKTHKEIKIKDNSWNFSRIIFAIAGVMSLITVIFSQTILDVVRVIATVFCIVMFLLQRDGVGDNGVSSIGSFFPWSDVKAYDVQENGKKTNALFLVEEKTKKKQSEYTVQLVFNKKDTQALKDLLKDKIGKKYRRMKR